MPFTVSVESGTLTGERVLPHFLNGNLTEVAEMRHGEHTAAAAHCWWQHALLQPSIDDELSKFVGVDVS